MTLTSKICSNQPAGCIEKLALLAGETRVASHGGYATNPKTSEYQIIILDGTVRSINEDIGQMSPQIWEVKPNLQITHHWAIGFHNSYRTVTATAPRNTPSFRPRPMTPCKSVLRISRPANARWQRPKWRSSACDEKKVWLPWNHFPIALLKCNQTMGNPAPTGKRFSWILDFWMLFLLGVSVMAPWKQLVCQAISLWLTKIQTAKSLQMIWYQSFQTWTSNEKTILSERIFGYSPTKTLSESNLKRWDGPHFPMKKKGKSFKRPRLSYSMMPNWNSMILHWHFKFWIGYTIAEINIDHAIHRASEDYSSFHAPMKLAMIKVKPPIYHWLLFVWSLSHAKLYQTPVVHNQFLKKKSHTGFPPMPSYNLVY